MINLGKSVNFYIYNFANDAARKSTLNQADDIWNKVFCSTYSSMRSPLNYILGFTLYTFSKLNNKTHE